MTFFATFWGVRGSIPTPGASTIRYGGNTPCISIDRGDRTRVILDAGSGIRNLGRHLMEQPGWSETCLLLTHTHWDHIQGLPFFQPLAVPEFTLRIFGAVQETVTLERVLELQTHPAVFPVPFSSAAAQLSITHVEAEPFEVPDLVVTPFRLCHPGTTLGFRLVPHGSTRAFAYVTDNELGGGGEGRRDAGWHARLVRWLDGAHTLVHDAMYTTAMMPRRAGWGHSTTHEAVDLAIAAGCARLVLFHHEPEHDDDTIDRLVADAQAYARERGGALEVLGAVEGMRLAL
ncbi:MAG: MBL fold metallo-hydrolase [Gemmatimonadales bacterium]|nr:MBL fold metallo-hydrolase [Gemmatimonadales bacterium]